MKKQSQKVQWTELHFLRKESEWLLRKESEWLHERDYGNKAAGQVKPMERDGERTRGERFERQGVL